MPPLASFSTTPNPAAGFVPLTVEFTNTSTSAIGYQWNFGDGTFFNGIDTSHIYTSAGSYTVILIATNGPCFDTAEITVVVYNEFSLIIPSIFSPNDDGHNDVFHIIQTGCEKLDGEIFDRWGLRLYEWHTLDGGWDGHTAAGSKAAEGTYYYLITVRDVHQEDHVEKGSFMLVR